MEQSQAPKRAARRRADAAVKHKKNHGSGMSVWVDKEAGEMLVKAAKVSEVTKGVYAAAAIRYFAEKGLDPTKAQGVGMAEMTDKLAELSQKIDTLQDGARKQSADIGNRLVGIWRTLEKNLYTHLGGEQDALYVYLERIEENLISKASATESQYLWPLLERVMRGGTDSLMGRRMSSNLLEMLKTLVPPGKVADSDMTRLNNEYSEARDTDVVRQSRELLDGVKLTERVKSVRPSIMAPPKPAVPSRPDTLPATPPKQP